MTVCRICVSAIQNQTLRHQTSYPHHVTFHSLASSIVSGCDLCFLLFHKFGPDEQRIISAQILLFAEIKEQGKHTGEFQPPQPGQDSLLNFSVETSTPELVRLFFSFDYKYVRSILHGTNQANQELQKAVPLVQATDSFLRIQRFEITLTSDPMILESSKYPQGEHTDSQEVQQQIFRWLTHCQASHDQCSTRANPEKWYPLRLLDIDYATDVFRIVEGSEILRSKPYITLSHPWGPQPAMHPPKLTVQNLSDLRKGQKLDFLSRQIFKDAITVTKILEIPYIWIDSLCIIQDGDDGADKRQQIPQMDEVYRNALLNISADRVTGVNPKESLFSRRSFLPFRQLQMPLSTQPGLNECIASALYQYVDSETLDKQLTNAPLNKRAWVMQERILAPRTLHFCQNQVFWECCENLASENYPVGFPAKILRPGWTFAVKSLEQGSNPDMQYWLKSRLGDLTDRDRGYLLWEGILRIYGRTEMTKLEDKLVAIAGVARYLQSLYGDQYIAGLWRKFLPMELLWYADHPFQSSAPQSSNEPRIGPVASKYRAPSFSWASCDGCFTPGHPFFAYKPLVVVSCVQVNARHAPYIEDQFGSLDQTGSDVALKVKGGLRMVKLHWGLGVWKIAYMTSEIGSSSAPEASSLSDPSSLIWCEKAIIRLDDPRNHTSKVVHCMPWAYAHHSQHYTLKSMLFDVINPEEGTYRRIGIVSENIEHKAVVETQRNEDEALSSFTKGTRPKTIYVI